MFEWWVTGCGGQSRVANHLALSGKTCFFTTVTEFWLLFLVSSFSWRLYLRACGFKWLLQIEKTHVK